MRKWPNQPIIESPANGPIVELGGGRSYECTYERIGLPVYTPTKNNQSANGPIGGYLLNCPLHLPMNESARETVNERPRSTLIRQTTIQYVTKKYIIL